MAKHNLLYCLIVFFTTCSVAQEQSVCESIHLEFLNEQHEQFADEEESPLTSDGRKDFKTINYYPYDASYCVEAQWVLTPGQEPFEMPTSTDRLPVYVKYGEVHFKIEEQALVLSVYQSLALIEEEGYEDYLFIPYNDLSNGVTSYGGGRYMDMRIPDSETIQLDLNSSYHPYCAYNHLYSCPIPPEENMLDVSIEAGVMMGINGRE